MTGVVVFLLIFAGCWLLVGSSRFGIAALNHSPGVDHGQQRTGLGRGWRASGDRDSPKAAVHPLDPAVMIDLLGAMLVAGAPVGESLAALAGSSPPPVAQGLRRVTGALALGSDWDAAWNSAISQSDRPTRKVLAELRDALRFAALTGASSAGMVHAYAAQLRRRRNGEAERRAATLGVRLVVPLGLCYLPAFICLGVLPMVLALLPRW
ncbi:MULTISPECIES: type II secretion system F family protein [unclassified Arthrobacter]|uniref:type II secretion system F family protein n=1 Tax=unclassified Arthrobacter TaxID=235627 RepID=UPI001492E2F2|nr:MULTISPECIES: type II secretion system F family protein [unclassified Arthrobacter]NOJ60154.1 type II secretion system F family protein [Arthrobacter sp. 260]NOJ63414.1 type II secretion system F family protein [Arthrobacter sp. 147(2020)]